MRALLPQVLKTYILRPGEWKGFAWLDTGSVQSVCRSRIPEGCILWELGAAGGWSVCLVLGHHRHKRSEAAIRPFSLIASQCQAGTLPALTFVSFTLIELLKKNKLPLVLCMPVGCSMCLWECVLEL